jgi:hypothetical protein
MYGMFPNMWLSRKDKTMEMVKRLVVARGQGRGLENSNNTDFSIVKLC